MIVKEKNMHVLQCDKCKQVRIEIRKPGMHWLIQRPSELNTVVKSENIGHLCDSCYKSLIKWLNSND